jgi:hypothetical protein
MEISLPRCPRRRRPRHGHRLDGGRRPAVLRAVDRPGGLALTGGPPGRLRPRSRCCGPGWAGAMEGFAQPAGTCAPWAFLSTGAPCPVRI